MLKFALLAALCCTAFAQDFQLVWSDEFDGSSIDDSKWEHEITAWGGGNGEFQVYTPDSMNSYVQDGNLYIKATPLSEITNPSTGQPYGEEFLTEGTLDLVALYGRCDMGENFGCYREGGDIPPIASARLRTANRFAFRYGRAEINAKMPVGDWLWPALWLLPEQWYYGGWPMSGEIDMTEAIGNRDYVCDGVYRGIQHMGSTLHWGVDVNQNKWWLTTQAVNRDDNNFGDNFHLYQLDWTPNGLEFYLDDEKILSIPDPIISEDGSCFGGFYEFGSPWDGSANPWTNELSCDFLMAPFDQEFHFILNVAVGGTWYIPEGCVNRGGAPEHQKPWPNGSSQMDGAWQFYNAKDAWYSTWQSEGDNNAMQVDYVRVYQPAGGYPGTEVPSGCPDPPPPRTCP